MIFVYLSSTAWFNFNLVTFYLKYLPGDIFSNMIAVSMSETIAALFSGEIVRCMGPSRAFTISSSLCAFGGFCLLIATKIDDAVLTTFSIVISKLASSLAISLIYMNILYYFPNQFLGRVMGTCGTIGKGVTILAPLVAETPWPCSALTMIVSCSIATMLSFWLKKP